MIKFNQNAWLKAYTDMNTDLRKKAKDDLKKIYFVYIKTNDIYKDITEDVGNTSNYELGRPLFKGKNKKVIESIKN